MSASARSDRLKVTARVTRQHGAIFIDVMREKWPRCDEPYEALEATGIMTWPEVPDRYDFGVTPAQLHFIDLEAEILDRAFTAAEPAIAAAFVRAARYVLRRERARQRKS